MRSTFPASIRVDIATVASTAAFKSFANGMVSHGEWGRRRLPTTCDPLRTLLTGGKHGNWLLPFVA